MSSISSEKNSTTNAVKISAVILNLASDKPDSDKNRKRKISRFFLTVAYEHCVTIKQTVIRAGRRVKKKTWLQKKWLAQTRLCVWPRSIYQYSNMAPRLSGQKWIFLSFFCLSIPKRDLNTRKTPLNIEVCPERLRSMLEYWYIECGLLVFVLNGCMLALGESYI